MRFQNLLVLYGLLMWSVVAAARPAPLRIAVAGLTHTHVHWIFNSAKRGDIEIVGVAEANRALAARYARQYGLEDKLFYTSLSELLAMQKPAAVAAFGSIYEHLSVVQQCAPLGIHVMVEKPLAVSLDHARQMAALARQHKIYLLTNYETTWYGSMEATKKQVQQKNLGDIRKIVVHDGHQGPKEIGVDAEFLKWLTDPHWNGAGALMDFGCYGANLATWLLEGERPLSVTAIAQQLKPAVYPKVDDEATIILQYPQRQVIIQASWNWPFSRKDLEVYGQTGALFAPDRNSLRLRLSEKEVVKELAVPARKAPFDDPFAFFAAMIQGTIKPERYDLSGLENNMLVMEILEAAKTSATEKRTVTLAQRP